MRGRLPAGVGLQGAQPRHRVVLGDRFRVAGARVGVRGVAGLLQLRRERPAEASARDLPISANTARRSTRGAVTTVGDSMYTPKVYSAGEAQAHRIIRTYSFGLLM